MKAIMYDSLCGTIYRCMFAGVDDNGHAQWVNITPGERPMTLDDIKEHDELDGAAFYLLAVEGETVQSLHVARLLGKVTEMPLDSVQEDTALAVRQLRHLGVKWDRTPLDLEVRVFSNNGNSRRHGNYSFWVFSRDAEYACLLDVDSFETVDNALEWAASYLTALEDTADIPISRKVLRIADELRRKATAEQLALYDEFEREYK